MNNGGLLVSGLLTEGYFPPGLLAMGDYWTGYFPRGLMAEGYYPEVIGPGAIGLVPKIIAHYTCCIRNN